MCIELHPCLQERMRAIVALGLTSDKPVEKMGSPLNTLSNHLASVLNFGTDEKDLLLMRHEVRILKVVLYLTKSESNSSYYTKSYS